MDLYGNFIYPNGHNSDTGIWGLYECTSNSEIIVNAIDKITNSGPQQHLSS